MNRKDYPRAHYTSQLKEIWETKGASRHPKKHIKGHPTQPNGQKAILKVTSKRAYDFTTEHKNEDNKPPF